MATQRLSSISRIDAKPGLWLPIVLGILSAFSFPGRDMIGLAAESHRILVVGQGPEQPVIQELARAYEHRHPGTVIDLEWDRVLDTIAMVKNGEADLVITGHRDPELRAAQVAWDGIAVIVNFTNPLSEVTSEQVRSLFTGTIQRWSSFEGSDAQVELIRRTPDQNIDSGFEESLGIVGKLPESAKPVRSDQKTLASVSGKDNAVSYISLKAALDAQGLGIPIRILTIDQIEPGEPTVKEGRYKLRRPVLFLSRNGAPPLVDSFTAFAQSAEGQAILSKMYTAYASPTQPKEAKPTNSHSPEAKQAS
ncbi:MAG: substrate-binding domain-containing protein [Nitrospiraceae bacterium]